MKILQSKLIAIDAMYMQTENPQKLMVVR